MILFRFEIPPRKIEENMMKKKKKYLRLKIARKVKLPHLGTKRKPQNRRID